MNKRIKVTYLNDCIVSTLKMVDTDHCFFQRYLTTVFGGENNLFGHINTTEKVAINNHNKIVICLRAGIDCGEISFDDVAFEPSNIENILLNLDANKRSIGYDYNGNIIFWHDRDIRDSEK